MMFKEVRQIVTKLTEVRRDGRKSLVDVVDVLGLRVKGVVVNILVVDTVLLTTGDTDLHLQPLLHGSGALEVLLGGGNVWDFRSVNVDE
jgi:hypothetical protein